MSSNFIEPPERDFEQLFKLAESELITMRTDAIEAAVLVAICVNASAGNGFFCCDPAIFRGAMSALIDRADVNAKEFLAKTIASTGFRKNQNPKFVYAERNRAHGESIARCIGGTTTDAAIFSCNWGLAQLPAWRIVEHVEADYKLRYLQAFLGDLNMQMRELIRVCVEHNRGERDVTLSMLMKLHTQRRTLPNVVDQAMRDWTLAGKLRNPAEPISAEYKV